MLRDLKSPPLRPRAPRQPRAARLIPDDDRFAQTFAALGETTRLRIMQLLPREHLCAAMYNVVELARKLQLRQPTVSHHLKILAQAGLIQPRRHSNNVYYYVDQRAVIAWLREVKSRFGCDGCRE